MSPVEVYYRAVYQRIDNLRECLSMVKGVRDLEGLFGVDLPTFRADVAEAIKDGLEDLDLSIALLRVRLAVDGHAR